MRLIILNICNHFHREIYLRLKYTLLPLVIEPKFH
jgi:hypothetical protein